MATAEKAANTATVMVKLMKSRAGCNPAQRKTLDAMGLKRREMVKTLPDNPAVRGMIDKVCHLVEVM